MLAHLILIITYCFADTKVAERHEVLLCWSYSTLKQNRTWSNGDCDKVSAIYAQGSENRDRASKNSETYRVTVSNMMKNEKQQTKMLEGLGQPFRNCKAWFAALDLTGGRFFSHSCIPNDDTKKRHQPRAASEPFPNLKKWRFNYGSSRFSSRYHWKSQCRLRRNLCRQPEYQGIMGNQHAYSNSYISTKIVAKKDIDDVAGVLTLMQSISLTKA